jgi:hypothetical protein
VVVVVVEICIHQVDCTTGEEEGKQQLTSTTGQEHRGNGEAEGGVYLPQRRYCLSMGRGGFSEETRIVPSEMATQCPYSAATSS